MELPQTEQNQKLSPARATAAGIILLIAAGIFCVLAFFAVRYFGIRPVVSIEYGENAPDTSVFTGNIPSSYVEPPSAKPEKGWHTIVIEANGRRRTVWMQVRDTVAPAAGAVERTISTKKILTPDELITSLTDADRVKIMFDEEPPFGQVGDYEIPIILEDVSGNRSSVVSLLHIRVVSNEPVTIEAGSDAPDADRFLLDSYEVESMTDITQKMLREPGDYPIDLTISGETYRSSLTVIDTVAPKVQAQTILREPEEKVPPEDFLTMVDDATATTAEYVTEPDYENHSFQTVTIRVTDAGGNFTDVSAGLLLTHATPTVIEARKTKLTPEECLPGIEYQNAVMIKDFVPDELGLYAVPVQVDGSAELALVEVRDTTPPAVKGKAVKGYLGHPIDPAEMCEITDATETTAVFETEPDWMSPELQQVTVIVTDIAGNQGGAVVQLTLQQDTEAPVLYGVKTRYYYVDEAIPYLEGIVAIDNADGQVPVKVDTSSVIPGRTGKYLVTYTASDAAGNSTSRRAMIRVKRSKVNADKLDRYVQQIMSEITTEDMHLADKVFAIYDYVFTHVRYTSRSDKTDWRREALRGIQRGKGDCYTSNSLARALLETTEAEIFIVQRKSYNTHHYWLLVNIGTGWYHFDATNSREHGYKCCMWTAAQCSVMRRFWVFETQAAPPVATERFDREKAIAVEEDWISQHSTGNTVDLYEDDASDIEEDEEFDTGEEEDPGADINVEPTAVTEEP